MRFYNKKGYNDEKTIKAYNWLIKKLGNRIIEEIDAAILDSNPDIFIWKAYKGVFITQKGFYVFDSNAFIEKNKICFIKLEDFKEITFDNKFLGHLFIETKNGEKKKICSYSKYETSINEPTLIALNEKVKALVESYNQPEEIEDDDIELPDIALDINTKLDNGNNIKITNYKESLKTGGTLIIEPKSWWIEYYFPGPDLRYNGEWFRIYASDLNEYIKALKTNFAKYVELKSKLKNEHITCEGELDMMININIYPEGVCLTKRHLNIRTQKELDKLLYDYKYAKARAKQIRDLLRNKSN